LSGLTPSLERPAAGAETNLFKYRVYGLTVDSESELPGLLPAPESDPAEITIHFGAPAPDFGRCPPPDFFIAPEPDAFGRPLFRVRKLEQQFLQIEYSDGTRFTMDATGSQVWATWGGQSSLEDTVSYLLGPILGLVLRMRGITCLHSSAVAVDGTCIALVGASGAGKSSTAAAFARLGFAVLTDDVTPVLEADGGFRVPPAYPRLRMWPETACLLFGQSEPLPLITPGWDKRYLQLGDSRYPYQAEPLKLSALYFLGPRREGAAEGRIAEITERDALMLLVSDTYATRVIDKHRRASEFELLGKLVASVPCRIVHADHDILRIDELCQAIVEDIRSSAH
jgi:hypothetical protein